MKTITSIPESYATSTVTAIATTAVVDNSTMVQPENDQAIESMVENNAKSFLVSASSKRYRFPYPEPVDMRPIMTLREYKQAEKDSLARLIYRARADTKSVTYNEDTSPLKRLKILQAIFAYVVKNREEKNLSFTKLDLSNIKVTIDENLSACERLQKRVANFGGAIDIKVSCPTFEKGSDSVSEEEEMSAMTWLCMQVMHIAVDCNGFAIMPKRVNGTGPNFEAPVILIHDQLGLELTQQTLEAAGSRSTDREVQDAVRHLRKLPISADSHDRVATFVHLYNFNLLEQYICTAHDKNDEAFREYIVKCGKKVGGHLNWNTISNFITKYSEKKPELFKSVSSKLDVSSWILFLLDAIEAIKETRRSNRMRVCTTLLMSPVVLTGSALVLVSSLLAKY